MQRSWPARRACSLLLSPCRICLFLSASQPPPPPPHSAWGVIKSVYACPQSKEIGIHTHKHKHPRSHLKRHALTHSATVETQIYRRIYLPTSPRQAFEHKTSNIYSVLSMACYKITFSQPVTLRPAMAANLLYLKPCVCVCVCGSVIKHVQIRSWMILPPISFSSQLCNEDLGKSQSVCMGDRYSASVHLCSVIIPFSLFSMPGWKCLSNLLYVCVCGEAS